MLLILVLYLIYDVVDIDAFCDFDICHSLLQTYSQDSVAPSLKLLSWLSIFLFVIHIFEAYSSTGWPLDLNVLSFGA